MAKLFRLIWDSLCAENFVEFERAVNRCWMQDAIAKYEITAFSISIAGYSFSLLLCLPIDLGKVWQLQLCCQRDARKHAASKTNGSCSSDARAFVSQLNCAVAYSGKRARQPCCYCGGECALSP